MLGAVAWLKLSLVITKAWSVWHHTHWWLLLIVWLQMLNHIMKREEDKQKRN